MLPHYCYVKAMDDFKKANINNEKNRKQKLKMNEKKRAAEPCIKRLQSDIESYSIAAEKKCDFTGANSFCHTLSE